MVQIQPEEIQNKLKVPEFRMRNQMDRYNWPEGTTA